MNQAYRVTRPGGWVESFEASAVLTSDDNTVADDSPMGQWGRFFIEGSKKLGSTFTVLEDNLQRKAMEEAGFTDIQEFNFKVSHCFLCLVVDNSYIDPRIYLINRKSD